jgi:hypothetical protein
MLEGEPAVSLGVFQKRNMVFTAEMKQDGWDIIFQAKRKKTKAEIADFEAREVALADYVDKYVTVTFAGQDDESGPEMVEPQPEPAAAVVVASDKERLALLRKRAEKHGCRIRKRADGYSLLDKDDGMESGGHDLDTLEWQMDDREGKFARQTYTACGMVIPGGNNSKAWLAAHPGATLEDFERALPPAPMACAAPAQNEPQPEPELDRSAPWLHPLPEAA